MVTVKVPHTVNGRFYGCWYFLDDGRSVYLAQRKPREVYHAKNAWCIDVRTLEEARERGVPYVGVICGKGKGRKFYLTLREDFFDSPFSFAHWGDTRQRGLPLSRFRVSPTKSTGSIAKAIKLR